MSNKASSYLGVMRVKDPDATRELILRTLTECGGSPMAAARVMGISKWEFWQNIYKLGLRGKPREIRERLENRFRLRGKEEA